MSEEQGKYTNPEDSTDDCEFISPAPVEGASTDPLVGKKIGSCTIKRIIGSGGMGVVYEAIQENPRRRVALKMMKRGITSRSATKRFEFESQTLARLKHQGVAQVYEAGTHDEGEGGVPYFIMEYVANAKPITDYAKEKKLGTRAKLKLFSKVCAAIQHGHLKGIVHRDLKPGNILVDSHGQPKIIDFGVARSTDSDLAVTTLQTDVGQLIGTLQYMSPEQCEADPSDIDIRSDVYALGVILYELLIGDVPYDLRRMAIHEAVQIVREQEPPKLSSISKHLHNDIETITLKALEKERDRRYQSATALQEDVLHYLNDEPITARPPGMLDYLRRFTKKHTAAAIAIAAVFVVLIGAVIVVSSYAVKLDNQRLQLAKEVTRSIEVKEFIGGMLSPDWDGEMSKELMMHLLAEASVSVGINFKNQPLVEAEIRKIIGTSYMEISKYAEAKPHLQEALFLYNKHGDRVRLNKRMTGISLGSLLTQIKLGKLHYLLGDYQKANELLKDTIVLSKSTLGKDHNVTLNANEVMADLLNRQGKHNESEKYINDILNSHRRTLGNNHKKTVTTLANLGVVYFGQGKLEKAILCFREALEAHQTILVKNHPTTLNIMMNLGNALLSQKKYEEAEPILLEVLELNRRILGNDDPKTAGSLNSVGTLLKAQGQFAEAEPYFQESLEINKQVYGDSHPNTLFLMGKLGDLLVSQGKFEEAEAIYAKSLETSRKVAGVDHRSTVYLIGSVGELLLKQEKYDEAETAMLEFIEINTRNKSADCPDNIWAYDIIAKIYEGWGKPEEAQRYRDMLPKQ